jgi:hypothetical protein
MLKQYSKKLYKSYIYIVIQGNNWKVFFYKKKFGPF